MIVQKDRQPMVLKSPRQPDSRLQCFFSCVNPFPSAFFHAVLSISSSYRRHLAPATSRSSRAPPWALQLATPPASRTRRPAATIPSSTSTTGLRSSIPIAGKQPRTSFVKSSSARLWLSLAPRTAQAGGPGLGGDEGVRGEAGGAG